MTILALKILHGTEAGKDTKHFVDERNVLLHQIGARTLNGAWFAGVLELGAVNAALWHAENALRLYRASAGGGTGPAMGQIQGDVAQVAQLAFRIQDLNDQRAALVEKINKDSGDHIGGQEKL